MKKQHWANQAERGHPFFLRVTTFIVRYFPACLIKLCVYMVVSYFYLTSPKQRKYISIYQQRLKQAYPQVLLPKRGAIYKQFIQFGEAICDRFLVWQKKIRRSDIVMDDEDNIYDEMDEPNKKKGQIFIGSHLGNIEICRALVGHHQGFRMTVLVHNEHAEQFNQALKKAGADDIELIQVSQISTATMLTLHHKLQQGEWLAIAADRIPVKGEKIITIPFLGHLAPFPQGPWLLAGLLDAPINLLNCVKIKGQYHLQLKKFKTELTWNKTNRLAVITEAVTQFGQELEQQCVKTPLQWFNFYDFWSENE